MVAVLLEEQQIAREFREAWRNRFLDEKFFYWLPNSVAAWVELCRSTEYRNADRAVEVLRSAAPHLVMKWAGAK